MKPFNLEEYLKNPSRKIVTGDGRKVRKILCIDAKGNYPIIALVERHDGTVDDAVAYTKDGNYLAGIESSNHDLFFSPEKHEGYINVNPDWIVDNIYYGNIYASKDEAKRNTTQWNGVTVKIEWED